MLPARTAATRLLAPLHRRSPRPNGLISCSRSPTYGFTTRDFVAKPGICATLARRSVARKPLPAGPCMPIRQFSQCSRHVYHATGQLHNGGTSPNKTAGVQSELAQGQSCAYAREGTYEDENHGGQDHDTKFDSTAILVCVPIIFFAILCLAVVHDRVFENSKMSQLMRAGWKDTCARERMQWSTGSGPEAGKLGHYPTEYGMAKDRSVMFGSAELEALRRAAELEHGRCSRTECWASGERERRLAALGELHADSGVIWK